MSCSRLLPLLALLWALLLPGTHRTVNAATVLGAYATVTTSLLNVRTGPGTQYEVLDTVPVGGTVAVIGRLPDCSWLQVVRPIKGQGWVMASLVTLSRACTDLPSVGFIAAAPGAKMVVSDRPVRATQPAAATIADTPVAASLSDTPAIVDSPIEAPAPAVASCNGLPQEQYASLSVNSAPTDRPAANHPDLNLALRGYRPASATAALLDLYPAGDLLAPQLTGLFGDHRQPGVQAAFQVYDWDWGCNCVGDAIEQPEVTLLSVQVATGESIYTPDSPRTLGDGFEALVLFATSDAITLKFTREDNVIHGYTLHVSGLCVEPRLLSLYESLNQAGRHQLPALRGGQPFGQASSNTVLVGIRDNGEFMEPRSLANWWR